MTKKWLHILLGIVIFAVFFCVIQKIYTSRVEAVGTPNKLVLADFYWWYPWYGAQWKNSASDPQYNAAVNVGGYLRQDAFRYVFTQSIPFLKSGEHKSGSDDTDGSIGTAWFKSNFSRAAASGIDVMTPMTRPDLPLWPKALGEMIRAQKELKSEGKPFPKLMLHFDGVEYWDHSKGGNNTNLTGPGNNFDVIWKGTQSTFDTIFANLKPEELSTYFYMYPDSSTFPVFVYRVEGNWSNVKTSDWWITQLRTNFTKTYPGKKLYLVLDDLWCNNTYGPNNTIVNKTCNGDNYYTWGGALAGAALPGHRQPGLNIVTVGPGFDNTKLFGGNRIKDRANGTWYSSQLQKANQLGANWILLETFNFGEEGTVIDSTTGTGGFGNTYLNITSQFVNSWKGIVKSGDLNSDNVVNNDDYKIFLANFGKTGAPGFVSSDFDKNGVVDIFDYGILFGYFGK